MAIDPIISNNNLYNVFQKYDISFKDTLNTKNKDDISFKDTLNNISKKNQLSKKNQQIIESSSSISTNPIDGNIKQIAEDYTIQVFSTLLLKVVSPEYDFGNKKENSILSVPKHFKLDLVKEIVKNTPELYKSTSEIIANSLNEKYLENK